MNELTPEIKASIDAMTHYEMCATWRFASVGSPWFSGAVGEYFEERLFNYYGGFTPAISKSLSF